MRNLHADVNQLLATLYAAPGDAQSWMTFLSRFSEVTGAAQGLLVFHDEQRQQTQINCGHGLEPEFAESYDAYYQYINPYITTPEIAHPLAGTFGLLDEQMPDREVRKTEFYHDYVLPQGLTIENGIRITRLAFTHCC